ncbi:unnamed protein product [Owenia fusiformis]|uniref:Actin-related protein 6 n=1 Tax=Owenia fusiformis TaxID=6347 RepID=A0A8J1TD45_OWEFU|nr:unnamed protein product [Owenia fusiformis]
MTTLVLDNGAHTVKVGYGNQAEPRVIPNCITKAKNIRSRIFIGDQLNDCKDLSGIYYILPFQKGYLVNWDVQRQVWDYMFSKDVMKVRFDETNLLITEPQFNFAAIQEGLDELFFEEYGFKSLLRTTGSHLSQHKYTKDNNDSPLCCLVVDSGYSFSHIVPYYNGKRIMKAVKRINVGGKVLTNHLKEVISYRQLMVMDETYVMNQLKEDVCYVSTQFWKDMDIAKKKGAENTVVTDYVLPDYTHIKRGFVKTQEETDGKPKGHEQIIRMCNERFAVPEVLFHPSDIGIHEMGISEAIVHCISETPEEMHPHLYGNIVLTGGNCLIPGFKERVENDVRSLAPDDYDIKIFCPENPITYTWSGGSKISKDNSSFSKLMVTRQQYEEHGPNICLEKFNL